MIQCKLATLPADRWPLNVHPTHPYCTHYNKSDPLPIQCKLATLPADRWPLNAHPTHPYRTHYNKSDRLPIQCKQCGIRFADYSAGKLDMQNHLDMHFRQNHKANQNMGCGHSCNWFVTLEVHNIFDLAYCFCWYYHRIGYRTPYRTLRERVVQLHADSQCPMDAKATAAAELAKCDAKLRALYVVPLTPNPAVHYAIVSPLPNSSHPILL